MRANIGKTTVKLRVAIAGGLVAISVVGMLSGVAFASGALQPLPPAGVAAEPGGAPAPAVTPDYPRNASGLTYGSLEQANSPDSAPDLILVEATNGKQGYVLKTVLDAATGANVSNPQEAIAWQMKVDAMAAAGQDTLIPVYRVDGTTQIGEFEISPSWAEPATHPFGP
jgi:hypothetical protein